MNGTVAATLRDATARLKAAGIETARLDAVVLLAEALGWNPDQVRLEPDSALPADAADRFAGLLRRRIAREPVSYILGRREFRSIAFRVSPAVLDPRPDTETLVEAVIARVPFRYAPLSIVDFGTGSGCILLSLLQALPNAVGLGVDLSFDALEVAKQNADRLELGRRAIFCPGNWGDGLEGPYDLLLSNPPYIETKAIAGLAPEVAMFEPRLALDGGADGLDAYRLLIPDLARLARPGALVALEVGRDQAHAVARLLETAGLSGIETVSDLAGIPRVVIGRRLL